MRGSPASGSHTKEFFTEVTESLRWNDWPLIKNSSGPLHISHLCLHCPLGKHSPFKPAPGLLLGEAFPDAPSHHVDGSRPTPPEQAGAEPLQHLSHPMLAPPDQEPSQGKSYLGEDLVHVSSSQLQLPVLVSRHWPGCVELSSSSLLVTRGSLGEGGQEALPGHTLPVGSPFPDYPPGGGKGRRAPLLPSLSPLCILTARLQSC